MRRCLEYAGIVSRFVSIPWIFVSFAFLTPPEAPYVRHATLLGLAFALPIGLTNVLAIWALRSVSHHRYSRLSAAVVLADAVGIIAIALTTAGSSQVQLWPLFVIPIIVAAYRFEVAGALVTASATSAAGVAMYLLAPSLGSRPPSTDLLTFAPALELVVALITGLLSRAHHNHMRQLTEIRALLRDQALQDPLTGLGNRAMLQEHYREAVRPDEAVSLLLLDLDGFKAVNDSLGHAAGDELLRLVAANLRVQARGGDLVARLGGDEFVIVLPGAGAVEAGRIAERVRQTLAAPLTIDGSVIRIGASIGSATGTGRPLDELLRKADKTMYQVKSAGRPARDVFAHSAGTRL